MTSSPTSRSTGCSTTRLELVLAYTVTGLLILAVLLGAGVCSLGVYRLFTGCS